MASRCPYLLGVGLFLICSIVPTCPAGERLVVHEWGTFTSLQNERGMAMGSINTDDEPVPAFVHRLAHLLYRPTEVPPRQSQGAVFGHSAVTMRLETPVIYFHLPKGAAAPITLDVDVQFRGGWLTEYFPDARATINGQARYDDAEHDLNDRTVGGLAWKGLTVGAASDKGKRPTTTDHVWTAPRAVDAADVATPGGEAERFLFYRGVAHVDAPLRIVRDEKSNELRFHVLPGPKPAAAVAQPGFTGGWLTDIRPDGTCAYRRIAPTPAAAPAAAPAATGSPVATPPLAPATAPTTAPSEPSARAPAEFAPESYAAGNLDRLRAELREALVKDGLFADEAEALLNTWELSYFKAPGLRFFFLVPRAWTDSVLPMRLSVDADITRTMVGRIELVTPRQRELVRRMAATKTLPPLQETLIAMRNLANATYLADTYAALASGCGDLSKLGVKDVPEIYRTYLELGRFRAAFLCDRDRPRERVLDDFYMSVELGTTVQR